VADYYLGRGARVATVDLAAIAEDQRHSNQVRRPVIKCKRTPTPPPTTTHTTTTTNPPLAHSCTCRRMSATTRPSLQHSIAANKSWAVGVQATDKQAGVCH
jgi:hypothetical protein